MKNLLFGLLILSVNVFASEKVTTEPVGDSVYIDDFSSSELKGFWRNFHNKFYNDNDKLVGKGSGLLIYNELFEESDYLVESDLHFNENEHLALGLIYGEDYDGNFYSVKLKPGKWGKITLYKHTEAYDFSGTALISSGVLDIDYHATHRISVDVTDSMAKVSLNGKLVIEMKLEDKFYNSTVGYVNIGDQYKLIRADNFNYQSK